MRTLYRTVFFFIAVAPMLLAYPGDTVGHAARPVFNNRDTPEEFLRDLYNHYNAADLESAPQILDRDTKILADPDLQKLIIKERKMSHGDISVIDSDPICDCQDFDKAVVKKIELSNQTQNSVDAEVTFTLTEDSPDFVQIYHLIRLENEWKIHDIKYSHSKIYMGNAYTLVDALTYAIKGSAK